MVKFKIKWFGVFCSIIFSSCNKTEIQPGYASIYITFQYTFGSHQSLQWDSLLYVTCNQDTISFSRLEYILSNFAFYSKGKIYKQKGSFYINPKENKNIVKIDSVLGINYDSISFTIGDNHLQGIYDIDIMSMFWPDMMGGGYHFLKLEGYYTHNTMKMGYAMHAGGFPLSPIKYTLKCPITISHLSHTLTLNHKLDKWFDGTSCYKVSSYNYSMGVDSLMIKILQNGKFCINFLQFK